MNENKELEKLLDTSSKNIGRPRIGISLNHRNTSVVPEEEVKGTLVVEMNEFGYFSPDIENEAYQENIEKLQTYGLGSCLGMIVRSEKDDTIGLAHLASESIDQVTKVFWKTYNTKGANKKDYQVLLFGSDSEGRKQAKELLERAEIPVEIRTSLGRKVEVDRDLNVYEPEKLIRPECENEKLREMRIIARSVIGKINDITREYIRKHQ